MNAAPQASADKAVTWQLVQAAPGRRLLEQQARFFGLLGVDDDAASDSHRPTQVTRLQDYQQRFGGRPDTEPRPL